MQNSKADSMIDGKCVLVGGGDFCPSKFVRETYGALVGVDSGYGYIKDLAKVDCVVGDFDSLGYVPDGVNVVKHDPIKDYTDLHLAIEYMRDKGYSEFVIYGGLGGRLDHTLSNIQTAYGFVKDGARIKFADEKCDIEFICDKKIFSGEAGETFSLLAFDECRGVNIVNGKYPLCDATLTNDYSIGVSNEFIGGDCEISVRQGILCFIRNTRKV